MLEVVDQAEAKDSAGSEQTQGTNKSRPLSLPEKSGEQIALHDNIASADLQNPSDALKILAQVADRAENGDFPGSKQTRGNTNQSKQSRPAPWRQDPSPSNVDEFIHYKPVQDGMISPEMVYHLFMRYAVVLYFTLVF